MGSNPIGGTLFNCSLPLAADRALDSAYFVVARRRKSVVFSLRLHCSLRSLRLALASRCLPHSLADERRVCSLARPGQRRASLAQHGGARSGVELLAPCLIARSARCGASTIRRLRRRSQTEERCLLAPPQPGGARSGGWIAQTAKLTAVSKPEEKGPCPAFQ